MRKFSILEMLQAYEHVAENFSVGLFSLAMFVSLLAAFLAAALYRTFYENRSLGSQVYRAFPLLALAITSLFICIQLSIPLSLGLLGSLSIIRFRTPIKEPEEVGFIMLVIASSVAAATYNFAFLFILHLFAWFALATIRFFRRAGNWRKDGLLVATFPSSLEVSQSAVESLLARHFKHHQIQSLAKQQGILSLQAAVSSLKTDAFDVQKDFADTLHSETCNIFFDRPGGMR